MLRHSDEPEYFQGSSNSVVAEVSCVFPCAEFFLSFYIRGYVVYVSKVGKGSKRDDPADKYRLSGVEMRKSLPNRCSLEAASSARG